MNNRPQLNSDISVEDFKDYYWLKEELTAFCKKYGIATTGNKSTIAERIISFLETGETVKQSKKRIKTESKFDWGKEKLSPDTIITDNYRNTENVRYFFKQNIDKHFKFNVMFCNWMKENSGKTLQDAINEWNNIRNLIKSGSFKTTIGKQFEYNTYIKDFLADNPTLKMKDAIHYWKLKKASRGKTTYSKRDLKLR